MFARPVCLCISLSPSLISLYTAFAFLSWGLSQINFKPVLSTISLKFLLQLTRFHIVDHCLPFITVPFIEVSNKKFYIPAVQMVTWKSTWKVRRQLTHMISLTMRCVVKRSNHLLLYQMALVLSWCSVVVNCKDEVSKQITPLKQVCVL